MKRRISEGELTEEGTDDVLSKVLGKPEHRGRVRGQGTHVKQSVYFNLPRQRKKKTIEERIQDGIQKFMKEEREKIVQERDEFWAAEMENIKALLGGKLTDVGNSPNVVSQQGSCSKGAHAILNDLELLGVRKQLDLDTDKLVAEKSSEKIDDDLELKVADIEKVDNIEEKIDNVEEKVEGEAGIHKIVQVESNAFEEMANDEDKNIGGAGCDVEWELTIDSPTNVVAYGTVDTVCKVIHGKHLPEENARVSITRVVQGSALIPFPIQDEITIVEQAVGTFVEWPRHLIVKVKKSSNASKETQKVSFYICLRNRPTFCTALVCVLNYRLHCFFQGRQEI